MQVKGAKISLFGCTELNRKDANPEIVGSVYDRIYSMEALISYMPVFAAMLILMTCSAFFSLSETAFFSLNQTERLTLAEKGKLGRLIIRLLTKPEPLLNSILLCNLFVNLTFFTLASIIAVRLGEQSYFAWVFGVGSLFVLIVFCEVLPKNLGVLAPQFFALSCCIPLSFLVRILQPILPVLSFMNLLSRRVIYPNLKQEPYLRVSDLERAVELSGDDAALLKREQRTLQNIVSLSDMEAAELMRPRSWLKLFRPPVSFERILTELNGTIPNSGYCLLTEPDSDDIASALSLTRLTAERLETAWDEQFEDVIYVPWSTSVAEVFDRLQQSNRMVAVVVNEFGETMGIITIDDIIATLFTREQGHSRGNTDRRELKPIGDRCWQLTGLTNLRTLSRKFHISFQQYSSLTVGGLLREIFERFPRVSDECHVEKLHFRVTEVDDDYSLVVQLTWM